MDKWIQTGRDVIEVILFQPREGAESVVLPVLGFIVLVVVLSKTSDAVDSANTGFLSNFLAAAAALILIVAANCAVALYLAKGAVTGWMVATTTAVVSALIIVPLLNLLHRNGLPATLISWFVALFAGVAVVYMLHVAWDAVAGGRRAAGKELQHQKDVHEVLNPP